MNHCIAMQNNTLISIWCLLIFSLYEQRYICCTCNVQIYCVRKKNLGLTWSIITRIHIPTQPFIVKKSLIVVYIKVEAHLKQKKKHYKNYVRKITSVTTTFSAIISIECLSQNWNDTYCSRYTCFEKNINTSSHGAG